MKNSISSLIATSIALAMVLLSGEMCQKSPEAKAENFNEFTNVISTGNAAAITVEEDAGTKDIESFYHEISGEWIGTANRTTNGKVADTTYFHGIVNQTNPGTYQIVIDQFKLDKKTRTLERMGKMVMTITITPEGTAKNIIIDTSEVLVKPNTPEPENALISEIIRITPSGSLKGNGSGRISIGGKNGKVSEYTSTWIFDNGILSITVRLKATFRILFFSKHYLIVNNYKARRGNDIISLIKNSD